jgi:hypothetical protein
MMDYQKIISDVVKIVTDSGMPPPLSERAGVKAWFVKVAPDLIDLGYDATGFGAVHAEFAAMAPEALEDSVKQAFGAVPAERIGDGHIIKWVTTNLPNILQLITTILAVIPK